MSRWTYAAVLIFLCATGVCAQDAYEISRAEGSAGPAGKGSLPRNLLIPRAPDFSFTLGPPDPLVPLLRPPPRRASEEQFHHPWERIHVLHISGLHTLRKRFFRSISSQRDWFFRANVYPFLDLPGPLYFGIETRRTLMVESDSLQGIVARQGATNYLLPELHIDRVYAFTLRISVR